MNREVFEGSDLIGLRLRAAKKPAVIPFLEIPPEEIDVEPITIDPFDLSEAEPISIAPLIVPMEDILPYDEDDDEDDEDDDENTIVPPPLSVEVKNISSVKSQLRDKTNKSSPDKLSLFGVGEIEPQGKSRRRSL
jgi:hypothetical protein